MRLLLCLLLTGCINTLGPEEWATPIWPPPSAQADYTWVWDHCVSTIRAGPRWPLHKIRWYEIPGDQFTWRENQVYGTFHDGAITLASAWVPDTSVLGRVVRRHELLHAESGDNSHPPWMAACAL